MHTRFGFSIVPFSARRRARARRRPMTDTVASGLDRATDGARGDARKVALEGFNARRRLGTGLHFDHAQLVDSRRRTLGDFLQTVPGLRVTDPTSTRSMMIQRNQAIAATSSIGGQSCQVAWFVDGHRMDIPGRSDAMTDALGGIPAWSRGSPALLLV